MAVFEKLFRRAPDPRDALRPLWHAIVARARAEHWYTDGAVPDTIDGRFDMVALVLALVLLRIEEAPEHARDGVLLTEIFVDDMDGQMRQIGFGDMIVGKQIGQIMSALGGRLGAYRDGADDPAAMQAALLRNLYRGEATAADAIAHVMAKAAALRAALAAMPVTVLLASDHLPGQSAA
ncbi:MAG: ubiquinol-cytochrome C chaperone family protein [Sphingopyxis sp.]|nr:ubiquinol-cytochrome C chaperone family protein [Sphingopyxis sp.]